MWTIEERGVDGGKRGREGGGFAFTEMFGHVFAAATAAADVAAAVERRRRCLQCYAIRRWRIILTGHHV